ncbi:MAG: hypothetical protein R3A80_06665 [Bdellovibrionota bacterium]
MLTILDGAGVSGDLAQAILDHYKVQFGGLGNLRLPIVWKHMVSLAARDYVKLREAGVSHEEALEASLISYVDDYLSLKNAGLPHERALAVADNYEPDMYLKLVEASISP